MTITYGSVCSGIEAPSSAWHPLGWKPLWFSEIEPFPQAVLAHHYPDVPDLGDMTALPGRILAGEVPAPDVFVGGTPCQSFSVAGLRKGLADPRGQLTRTFVEILDALDTVRLAAGKPPAVCLYENVPGILSDKDNAFGNFLAALVGEDDALLPPGGRWSNCGCVLGPTRVAAWRVLDAQYFGVAQRRRRVFVVVSARSSGVDPVEVLLVEQGVRRDTPPSREAGQGSSSAAARGADGGGRELAAGHDDGGRGGGGGGVVAPPLTATNDPSRSPQSAEVTAQVEAALRATCPPPVGVDTYNGTITGNVAATLSTGSATTTGSGPSVLQLRATYPEVAEVCGTLSDGAHNGGGGSTAKTRTRAASSPSHYPELPEVAWCLQHRDAKGSDSDTKPGHVIPVQAAGGFFDVAVRRLTERDTLQQGGINHAHAEKAGSGEVLRALHDALGEEAFGEWGLGVLASFLPPEVLRKAVHGLGLRCPTLEEFGLVNYALPRPEDRAARAVLQVRRFVGERCPSFGWEPHEQRALELGAYLSELSQPGASAAGVMSDLWAACEGFGVLRKALSAVQEVGRSARRETKPAPTALAVRRLVPEECEFLQGFARGFTRIPWKGKPAEQCPDGPRYRALGNSMAVPVIRWIGVQLAERISLAASRRAH